MRRRAVFVAAGMISLLGVALFFAPESLRDAARYAGDHPVGLVAAFGAYTAAFVLRAAAWRWLLPRESVSPAKLFSLIMGALFLNHAAPAKAGDFARMYALARQGVAAGRAVASVLASRACDLAGLVAVFAVAWTVAGAGGWGRVALPALIVVGCVAALPVLVRVRLPARLGSVGRYAARLQSAMRETGWRAFAGAFAFAAPAWVFEAGILFFVARGIGLELSLAGIVAASCFAVLAAAVPLTPGSVGTYEAGMVLVLVALGVPAETAFAAAVLTHAVKFLYAFAAAPFAVREGIASTRPGKVQPG